MEHREDRDAWQSRRALAQRYVIYDLKNKVVKNVTAKAGGDSLNTTGDDALTTLHTGTFLDAIRGGARLTAPIGEGAKSVLLCHLGTIAQQTGRILHTDPTNGHILGDPNAMKSCGRDYERGWAPVV